MKNPTIIGAIAGDVIGSRFELDFFKRKESFKSTEFELLHPDCHFTDDTVLTVAITDALLNKKDFSKTVWEYGKRYPNVGYGGMFKKWLKDNERKPYNSFGNGSAMRVSPIPEHHISRFMIPPPCFKCALGQADQGRDSEFCFQLPWFLPGRLFQCDSAR